MADLMIRPFAIGDADAVRRVVSAAFHPGKADRSGEPLIVLEGDPTNYSRLGFVPAATLGIDIPLPDWPAVDEMFDRYEALLDQPPGVRRVEVERGDIDATVRAVEVVLSMAASTSAPTEHARPSVSHAPPDQRCPFCRDHRPRSSVEPSPLIEFSTRRWRTSRCGQPVRFERQVDDAFGERAI